MAMVIANIFGLCSLLKTSYHSWSSQYLLCQFHLLDKYFLRMSLTPTLHGSRLRRKLLVLYQELFQTVREFHACKQKEGQSVSFYVLKMKSYIDNLERLGHAMTQNLSVSLILVSLRKEYDGFVQNYNMHSMGKTVTELHAILKLHDQTMPLKEVTPALQRKGKAKMGNAHVPAPSYAPKPKNHPTPKKDNIAKDAIRHQCGEDDIYEIVLSNTNDSSMYAISNKRSKLNLDSALLWHYLLRHINKKRIEKLQHDGLLDSTDIKSFEKCVAFMSNHLKDHGIIAHKTPPMPQHNGVLERRNRTILDMVQSMMSQTTLPKSFWDYALKSAARILNMVPTKKVDKTPYEVWYGQARYPKKTIGYSFYYPPEKKEFVAQNAEFLENSLIAHESSGSLEDLEIIQEEDTHPSIDTSLNHEEDDQEIDEPQSDINPILDIRAIRILIAIAAFYDYEIWQMDVKAAFLNGYLNEEKILKRFYMENSKRGTISMQEKLKLSKSEGASTLAEIQRMQNILYALAVGLIMYVVRCTRLDVAFHLRKLTSDFNINPDVIRNERAQMLYTRALDAFGKRSMDSQIHFWVGVVPTIEEPINMYCDNTGPIAIAKRSEVTKAFPKLSELTKKIDVSTAEPVSIVGAVVTTDSVVVTTNSTTRNTRVSTADDITMAETLVYIRKSVSKDKGKGKIAKFEPVQTKTKLQQEQERLGYEVAVRLPAELEEEERQRIARVHESASSFNVEEWEDIQARVKANEELVDDLVMLWSLVKEKFNSIEPTDDKEREIWVEVHHVSTEKGIDIYMLVEKECPLSRGTLTLILVAKLLVEQDNEMSKELLRKIFMQAERPRR
ncbi:zinc finger, CCHC-type containing protein [Tanacetum coccineum]